MLPEVTASSTGSASSNSHESRESSGSSQSAFRARLSQLPALLIDSGSSDDDTTQFDGDSDSLFDSDSESESESVSDAAQPLNELLDAVSESIPLEKDLLILGKDTVQNLHSALTTVNGLKERLEDVLERTSTIEHMVESIYYSPGMPGYTNTAMDFGLVRGQGTSRWNPHVISTVVLLVSSVAVIVNKLT